MKSKIETARGSASDNVDLDSLANVSRRQFVRQTALVSGAAALMACLPAASVLASGCGMNGTI